MRMQALLLPCLLLSPLMAQKATGSKAKPASSEEAQVDWDGEWSMVASRSDNLSEQIEAHLKDQNFAMKLFWKKKIQAACQAYEKMDIMVGDGFSVTLGRERPIDTPADGTVNDWKRKDETVLKASLTKDGPTMIQNLQGDGYSLKHVYSMRKDGASLALQITYTHPKLDNPFSYKLVFKRND